MLSTRQAKKTWDKVVEAAFEVATSTPTSERGLDGVICLTINDCDIEDSLAENFFGHFEASLFPRLKTLSIKSNKVGDHGARALSHAMSPEVPAFSSLVCLNLTNNRIADVGLFHLASAWAGGGGAKLVTLLMDSNRWGDQGALALADALLKGALPRVAHFGIRLNRIGDRGIEALTDALYRDALPACRRTWVRGNLAQQQVQEKYLSVVAQRRQNDLELRDQAEIERKARVVEMRQAEREKQRLKQSLPLAGFLTHDGSLRSVLSPSATYTMGGLPKCSEYPDGAIDGALNGDPLRMQPLGDGGIYYVQSGSGQASWDPPPGGGGGSGGGGGGGGGGDGTAGR